MKTWMTALVFLYSSLTSAEIIQRREFNADNATTEQKVEILYLAFLDPLPKLYNTSDLFFYRRIWPTEAQARLLTGTHLAQWQELKEKATIGRGFAKAYYEQAMKHLPPEHVRYALDADQAILEDALATPPQTHTAESSPLTELEARKRAWQEMSEKFGIDPNIRRDEFARRTQSEPHFQSAELFFRQRYFRLQQMEVQKTDLKKVNVTLAKARFIQKLEELRKENLANAAYNAQFAEKMIDGSKRPSDDIFIRRPGYGAELNMSELSRLRVEFAPREKIAPDSEVLIALSYFAKLKQKAIHTVANWYDQGNGSFHLGQRPEWKFAQELLKPSFSATAHNRSTILIETPKNYRFQITERHWSQILSFISERQLEVSPSDRHSEARFAINRWIQEAPRRDQQYADLIAFLLDAQDTSLDLLVQRLRLRIKNRLVPRKTTSLQDELTYYGPSLTDLDALRWWGYRQHPTHWLIREEMAKMRHHEKLEISPRLEYSVESSYFDFSRAKAMKPEKRDSLETKLQKTRYLSKVQKATRVAKFYGAAALGAASLWFINPSDSTKSKPEPGLFSKLWHFVFDDNGDGAAPGGQSGEGKQRAKKTGALPGMDEAPQLQNHTKTDLNDGEEKEEIFSIGNYVPIRPLPKLFLSPNNFNLPQEKEFFAEKNDSFSEPQSVEKVDLHSEKETKADFSIQTKSHFSLTQNRLGILAPPDHDLVALDVVNLAGEKLHAGLDYEVYRLPHSGLIYIEINRDAQSQTRGPYAYQASYRHSIRASSDPVFEEIDPRSLSPIVHKLQEIGATELSEILFKKTWTSQSYSLAALQKDLEQTGRYTYDKQKKEKAGSAAYKRFQPFLRNGVFFYQCTGSNNLMVQIQDDYFSQVDPARGQFDAQHVTGYYYDPANSQKVYSDTAHMITLSTRLDRSNVYRYYDATPQKKDPKYSNEPAHLPAQNHATPGGVGIPFSRARMSSSRAEDEAFQDALTPKTSSSGGTGLDPLKKRLDQLQAMNHAASLQLQEILKGLRQSGQNPAALYNNPVTRALAASQKLHEQLSAHHEPIALLTTLIALDAQISNTEAYRVFIQNRAQEWISNAGSVENAIKALLDQINLSSQAFFQNVFAAANERRITGYESFLNENFSMSMASIARQVTSTEWFTRQNQPETEAPSYEDFFSAPPISTRGQTENPCAAAFTGLPDGYEI